MKNLDLDFTQRFKLAGSPGPSDVGLLGSQQGPLGKTAPYLRVFDKVRFTDAENAQIKRVPISGTQVSLQPPDADFGKLAVELEDADCIALRDLIENHPTFTTTDHWWTDSLLTALK